MDTKTSINRENINSKKRVLIEMAILVSVVIIFAVAAGLTKNYF